MKYTDDVDERDVRRPLTLRHCPQKNEASSCLGRDWYHACLDCIADLERHAAHHEDLQEAYAPWCGLCAAVGDALNDNATNGGQDDVGCASASLLF